MGGYNITGHRRYEIEYPAELITIILVTSSVRIHMSQRKGLPMGQ